MGYRGDVKSRSFVWPFSEANLDMNSTRKDSTSLFGVVLARLVMFGWARLRGQRVGKRAVVLWMVLAAVAVVRWVMENEGKSVGKRRQPRLA